MTTTDSSRDVAMADVTLRITGTVQGVGFRPFVARLAAHHGLAGWVRNDDHGVILRASGPDDRLSAFRHALTVEAPPAARIDRIEELAMDASACSAIPDEQFEIRESRSSAARPDAAVAPDLAVCDDCRRELADRSDRRHAYPFINCTNCGPRYSIVIELPYDRPRTTMAGFTMCPECAREYGDPTDRRYHAQPNACPVCGPHASLVDASGRTLAERADAIAAAAVALGAGQIVAVKGVGGFHLMVDACDDARVRELRRRKHREEKPLAVMFTSLEQLRLHAHVDGTAAALLASATAPIVLVHRQAGSSLAASIAPGNPWIGALLPYAPLHVLLLQAIDAPLVATSANFSEEPICSDNAEALARLRGIADLFLLHNRPIARPVDDSVVRLASTTPPILLRRARGYAPSPQRLPAVDGGAPRLLCVGGHLKSTVAVTAGESLVLSPHIGDLSNPIALTAFRRTIELLSGLYGGGVERVVCDAHPDYASTRYAQTSGLPVTTVQHHLAHVLACLLEHPQAPARVLGVAWDGTGYGNDGTIWGGEFILVDRASRTARRVASLRPFVLPGGEAAVRETRRCALGALHAAGMADAAPGFTAQESSLLTTALKRRLNAPVTTSAGRLFDAVAALLGLAERNRFEGQAAMAVEFAANRARGESAALRFALGRAHTGERLVLDWAPALTAVIEGRASGVASEVLAMRFHRMLANAITAVAREVGVDTVALTGGCFQNALLVDLTVTALRDAKFTVLTHHELPPNDNSIAAGQAVGALLGLISTTS